MAKRVVTRIGDIFCVEYGDEFKCYFQYIAKDEWQLNSAVIRVFTQRYPMDYKPDMDEIVSGEVLFYTHTFIQPGLWTDTWYKVGKSKNLGLEALDDLYFCTEINARLYMQPMVKKIPGYIPEEVWNIWKCNQEPIQTKIFPRNIIDKTEEGAANSYTSVYERIRDGYYNDRAIIYSVLKRRPRPDVDTYIKVEDDGKTEYYHFYGENAVREIILLDNKRVCLSKEHPEEAGLKLRELPFWATNWKYNCYISREEFEREWNDE